MSDAGDRDDAERPAVSRGRRPISRRLGCLALLLIWLVLAALPLLAFGLAFRGQLQFGGEERHLRLFMAQSDDVEGIGVEWTRPTDNRCTRTTVRFLAWRGESPPVAFCSCHDSAGNVVATGPAACPG